MLQAKKMYYFDTWPPRASYLGMLKECNVTGNGCSKFTLCILFYMGSFWVSHARHMNYCLYSLKGDYIGDYMGDHM